ADRAREDGVAELVTSDARAAIDGADLVVYATPVSVTIDLLREHAPLLATVAAVTDVGSVKIAVMAAAGDAGITDRFVGGHPMCGREQSGYSSAVADLFTGATVWLVPGSRAAPLDSVSELWQSLGGIPRVTDAAAHDRLVAWTSHLPQLLASVLGGALGAGDVARDALGPGGRDVARLARSPASLWTDILLQNRSNLEGPVAASLDRMTAFAEALQRGDRAALRQLLEEANAWANET
ncbi:MAG: prephenate dehydrogenase, partial [Longimicrobiales bacterium]